MSEKRSNEVHLPLARSLVLPSISLQPLRSSLLAAVWLFKYSRLPFLHFREANSSPSAFRHDSHLVFTHSSPPL